MKRQRLNKYKKKATWINSDYAGRIPICSDNRQHCMCKTKIRYYKKGSFTEQKRVLIN